MPYDLNTSCHQDGTDKCQYETRADQLQTAIRAYCRVGCAVHRVFIIRQKEFGGWRNIAITLIDPAARFGSGQLGACKGILREAKGRA